MTLFFINGDEENAETEQVVKGGSEASWEKQSSLEVYGFANRKWFTYILRALVSFGFFYLYESLLSPGTVSVVAC